MRDELVDTETMLETSAAQPPQREEHLPVDAAPSPRSADATQPAKTGLACGKCGGRLLLERGAGFYEDEWACLNCGQRVSVNGQRPSEELLRPKRAPKSRGIPLW